MEKEAGSTWWNALRATRPTPAGWSLHYAAGLLLFAAVFSEGRHRQALFLGASLRVTWECPARVFAAEEFPLRITVANRGRGAITGIEFIPSGSPAKEDRPGAVLARVPAGASASLDLATRVRHRGRHHLMAPRIFTGWPFGLFRATLVPVEDLVVLAYPRRVPVPTRALRSGSPEVSTREIAAAVPRGGELLRGVRGWAPGDAPRAIAWRASARHGRLLTREFEREDAGRAVVAVDIDPRDIAAPASVRADAVERACSLAASLVLRLRGEGRRTSLAIFTPEPVFLGSMAGERGLGRALETLAMVEAPARKDPRRDPLTLIPPASLRGARILLVKAAIGSPRSGRGPHGCEVITLPSLRATFLPEPPR